VVPSASVRQIKGFLYLYSNYPRPVPLGIFYEVLVVADLVDANGTQIAGSVAGFDASPVEPIFGAPPCTLNRPQFWNEKNDSRWDK